MRVKLVRKFANALNGIDLTKVSVGDIVHVKPHEAAMLIAEGWAEEVASARARASTQRILAARQSNAQRADEP
jgi:hypothetical protein